MREVQDFYSLGADRLWITFADGRLWLGFAAPKVALLGGAALLQASHARKIIGGRDIIT